MNKIVFILLFTCLNFASNAQSIYDTISFVKHTSIKNQQRSGTCWAFGTISFIESELIRMEKGEHDLGEMYIVFNTWPRKIEMHLRMQGENYFTMGGQMHDVMRTISKCGLMPEKAYGGYTMKMGHDHSSLDTALFRYVKDIANLTYPDFVNDYSIVVDSILVSHLQKPPQNFYYKHKEYSVAEFSEKMALEPQDYITITSYTHRPYYEYFVLEDRFNWDAGLYYNLPLKVFLQTVDDALESGYSLVWDGDVSETGFSAASGFAKLDFADDSDWEKLRQKMYDNHQTKIDHVMHLVGKLKNSNNEQLYLIKNSWDKIGVHNGYILMDSQYFMLKTVALMVHKDALPENVRNKL